MRYLRHCDSQAYSNFVDTLPEIVMQIQGTMDGCLAVVAAFNYATAKQRKKLLQEFKPHAVEMALDKESVLVLLRALDVTDDTVLLRKTILSPLIEQLEDVFDSQRARLLFLHILDPR